MIKESHLWHFLQFWHSVTLFFVFCFFFLISLPSFFHSVKIRLGIYQPNIKNQHEQTQSYSMTVPYPDFNSEYLSNDLMMIKLSEAAKLTTQVGTIAIAMEPLSLNESCFIPTWTWSKYKNRKCLTPCSSSWEGFGAGENEEGYTWGTSQVWLSGKESACSAGDARDEDSVPGLGRFLEEGMTVHSSILAWRILWTEDPGRFMGVIKSHTWLSSQHARTWRT